MNLKSKVLVLLSLYVIPLIFCGCEDEDPEELFNLIGQVFNVTDRFVRNADVIVLDQSGNVVQSTTTDNEGNYMLEELPNGTYTVEISKNGYNVSSESITISGNDVPDADFSLVGNAILSGEVINSQTGLGLANAILRFTEGLSLSTGADTSFTDLFITTDANGNYNLSGAPTGNYVCVVEAEGFTDRLVEELTFDEGENDLPQTTVVEKVAEGQIRIVLGWGASPFDLDTHLTGPTEDGASRFHLYFGNGSPIGSNAFLDVDDTNSFGPETTTIEQLTPGVYRFSVHNFSNQSESGGQEIFNSPTIVEVFGSAGLLRSFSAPAASGSDGNTWRVFEMEVTGDGLDFTALSSFDQVFDESDGDNFRTGGKRLKVSDNAF